MPLPAALLAKLSKRGIVPDKSERKVVKKDNYKGYQYCPNKYNIHHTCNTWCETTWKGHTAPDPNYLKNMQKLTFMYPVPHTWTEVFDKGLGRYYYWNMENDLVSWLPPKHPKAVLTQSAAKLREQLTKIKPSEKGSHKESKGDNDDDKEPDNKRSYKSGKREYERDRDRDRDRDRERNRDRDDKYHRRDKRSRKNDILDPMDPASYSDIPPGTWSDGLETNKERADNTASGVLFQQRPYPSPGEVLAGNKEKSLKKQSSRDESP